ncbi:MAG: glycosyltransferase family A protein [Planctomycetota bacterium]|nr:glycosyltransferase family A protein [Planctomycetota bacterium]
MGVTGELRSEQVPALASGRPLVTVGLPVFNGERYLRGALEANLAQTFEDFELLVCDNASTDATSEILREFAARDPRVRVHRHDENLGAAGNYNSAVALARGTYFRWTPHDDLVAPTHLERLMEVHRAEGDGLALVYPQTSIIDAEGLVVDQIDDRAHAPEPEAHLRLERLLRINICNPVLGLIPLELLQRTACIGPYRSSDKVLLFELSLHGRVIEVPERLFFRRRDEKLQAHTNLSAAEKQAWFDPRSRERAERYRWTLVRHSFDAVQRAPLSFVERQRCRLAIVRDMARWRHQLWGELRGRATA